MKIFIIYIYFDTLLSRKIKRGLLVYRKVTANLFGSFQKIHEKRFTFLFLFNGNKHN